MERYDKARQHIEKQRYYFADKSSHIQIVSHSAMSNSLRPHGVWPVSLLCPWNSSGKNTGVGCYSLLQGIFLTQESNQPRSLVFSHVWMWELDHKVWVPKNWCFLTVVLKTLESSLDHKEIKPVHPKGNQSWILIRKTNAEAKAPILWPSDANSQLFGKDPNAEKDWRQKEKGMTEGEMVG